MNRLILIGNGFDMVILSQMARRQRQLSGYCTEHITQLQFYKHAIIQGQSREQGAMQNNIVASR